MMISSLEPEQKVRKQSISPEKDSDRLADLLPDSKDFEEAILAAVLGSGHESGKFLESRNDAGVSQQKVDKRLKVFQDITLSLSPRA